MITPQIQLDTPPDQPNISLDDGVNSPLLSTDQVNTRATKAHFAAQGTLPDNFQDIHNAISTGNEDQFRTKLASAYDQKKANDAWTYVNSNAGRLTPEDIHSVSSAASKPSNPDTIVEDRYAQKYMSALNYDPMPSAWKEAINKYPDIAAAQTDVAHGLIAHNELVNRYIQDNEAAISQQSYLGYGYDFLKGAVIPFYNEAVAREHYTSLFGKDLENQAQEFYSMPTDEASAWLKKNYESINSHSPQLASQWLHALLGQSSTEKTLNSIGTLADISVVGSPIAKAMGTIAKSMVIGSKAAEVVGPARAAAASAGNLSKAGDIGASRAITAITSGHGDPIKDAVEQLPSIVKVNTPADAGNFGQEKANRLIETVDTRQEKIKQFLLDHPEIERTPDLQWSPENMGKLYDYVKDTYKFDGNVLNVSPHTDLAGQQNAAIILGKSDGTYFDMKLQAEKWLSLKGIKDGRIMRLDGTEPSYLDQHGPFYIELTRPISEREPFIRDTLASTPFSQSKKGFVNSLIGWARTPDETQSPLEMANRKVVDNAPSVLKQLYREIAQPMLKMSKEDRVDFERFTLDQEKTGKWFDTPLELEGQYQQFSNGMLPSEHFTNSYFAYKQARLLQHTVEEMGEYKRAHRGGNLTVRVRMEDADGNNRYSDYFNAKPVDKLTTNDGGVYVTGLRPGSDKVIAEGNFSKFPKLLAEIHDKVKKGELRVYRLDDPDSHPLNNFGKVDIRHGNRPVYVVGPNIEEQALSFGKQQFKPDVTRKMDHGFVLAQARTSREGKTVHYVEDTIAAAHDSRATLQDLAKDFNTAQDHLANGRLAEAEAHVNNHLPMSWEDFQNKYKQQKDPSSGRWMTSQFNKTEPWQVIPSDKMLIETSNNGIEQRALAKGLKFNDTTKSQNARKQGMHDLLQQRDAQDIFSVRNIGTHDNPVWDLAPVRYVDPLTTMNRAFSNVTKSLFMNDFKIASIEHWLEEGRKQDAFSREVRDNAYWNFKTPPWKSGIDPTLKRQLETTKFQIEQFIGVPSKLDQTLHSWSQHLADSIYTKWNPDHYGPIARSMLLTPSWALGNVTNFANFARSFTFNAMMGLFNPVHLFLWSMNYSNIFGIAGPIRASQGTMGAVLHQMARWNRNPEILAGLDKTASRMGIFKPGEWMEAEAAAQKYGWGIGRRELSFQPHELNPKVFQSGINRFLDAGQIFLRGADRNLQYGAWYTAYKEYREANAVGQLTNKDWIKILDRADLLSGNMSNASRSSLQNGVMGFPTQFLSYQLRMWEMFTGSRLTSAEKIRLLSTYGALFGLPASAGLLTGPIPIGSVPFGDRIRQAAIDNGYVTGDGAGITTAMEGFLGQLSKLATGSYLDVGKRYGDYGIDLTRDKTIWDLIGGATGSELVNIASSLHPFFHMAQTFIAGTEKFQPSAQDIIDIAQNAQTVAIGNRSLIALNTGHWVSRNGTVLEDKVSPERSVIQSLMGLTSQGLQDVYTRDVTLKEQEASWTVAENEATKNYHLALQAQKNNDPEQAHKFLLRARIILDWARLPNERWKEWMRRSSSDWESTIDESTWKYYMDEKNTPLGQGQSRLDTFQKIKGQQ